MHVGFPFMQLVMTISALWSDHFCMQDLGLRFRHVQLGLIQACMHACRTVRGCRMQLSPYLPVMEDTQWARKLPQGKQDAPANAAHASAHMHLTQPGGSSASMARTNLWLPFCTCRIFCSRPGCCISPHVLFMHPHTGGP